MFLLQDNVADVDDEPSGNTDSDATPSTSSAGSNAQGRESPPIKRGRKRLSQNNTDKVMGLLGNRLALSRNEDEYDCIGKNIAVKLRKMSNNMRIYAEKIISDVLYEGELGTLSANTRVTTQCNIDLQPHTPPVVENVVRTINEPGQLDNRYRNSPSITIYPNQL